MSIRSPYVLSTLGYERTVWRVGTAVRYSIPREAIWIDRIELGAGSILSDPDVLHRQITYSREQR